MRKFHELRSQKGLTMVELMVIMAIVAVLAGISIPMWVSYMPTMRLNGAARNLQLSLALARMKAVSRNRSISLLLQKRTSNPWEDYRLQVNNAGTWEDDTSADRPAYPRDLDNQGISIATSFPGNRIIFNPRGASVASIGGEPVNGTVTLTNRENKSRTINITGVTGTIVLN